MGRRHLVRVRRNGAAVAVSRCASGGLLSSSTERHWPLLARCQGNDVVDQRLAAGMAEPNKEEAAVPIHRLGDAVLTASRPIRPGAMKARVSADMSMLSSRPRLVTYTRAAAADY